MNEQQVFQVEWGTKAVPTMGWGVKVFADVGESARNATESRRFYDTMRNKGVHCRLQTALGVVIRDSANLEYEAGFAVGVRYAEHCMAHKELRYLQDDGKSEEFLRGAEAGYDSVE